MKLLKDDDSKGWKWDESDISSSDGKVEKFAARFKTLQQANEFRQIFEKAQSTFSSTTTTPSKGPLFGLPTAAATGSPPATTSATKPFTSLASVKFEKRCTLFCLEGKAEKKWVRLGTGNLKIIYDDDMLCARIVVEVGDGKILCDTIIAMKTVLQVTFQLFFSCNEFLVILYHFSSMVRMAFGPDATFQPKDLFPALFGLASIPLMMV